MICVGSKYAISQSIQLAQATSPADNPLKGLVPYSAANVELFPHSLEFFYIPLNKVMVGDSQFDWTELEMELDKVASRGCQAVIRVWVEYPGLPSGLPSYLRDQGVKTTEWTNELENPPKSQVTPDYEDERLIVALEKFIAALGTRYDNDPRLGYITAGLLGEWGEWHNWPRDELFASKSTQQRVLKAYETAFKTTPILLRYPAGKDHSVHTANDDLPFGYHDDSFAWATLTTGKRNDYWYYMTALTNAGTKAVEKWKTQPIGGEIRPEIWGEVFDAKPKNPNAQDFAECVRQTHVTWLMDSGMFRKEQSDARKQSAVAHVQKMGYDFWVQSLSLRRLAKHETELTVSLINQGVAPFYRDWKVELAFFEKGQGIKSIQSTNWSLRNIMPETKPTSWIATIRTSELTTNTKLLLRVVNPLPNGKSLRFANASQDKDVEGWLSLN